MKADLIWHGHSTFELHLGSQTILLDPFFTDNPAANITAQDVSPDAIIVSHGHADHVGDTVEIAKNTGATVIANFEIATWLGTQGLENVHPMHIGGQHKFDFGTVKLTIAHHGSALPDGSYGGNPAGIILKTDAGTLYFAGDTGLFYDMTLIGEEGIDTAILPIGDNFTMGPDDAVKAVKFIKPKRAIPCHYNTWPVIEQNPQLWVERVNEATDSQGVVPQIGTPLSLFP